MSLYPTRIWMMRDSILWCTSKLSFKRNLCSKLKHLTWMKFSRKLTLRINMWKGKKICFWSTKARSRLPRRRRKNRLQALRSSKLWKRTSWQRFQESTRLFLCSTQISPSHPLPLRSTAALTKTESTLRWLSWLKSMMKSFRRSGSRFWGMRSEMRRIRSVADIRRQVRCLRVTRTLRVGSWCLFLRMKLIAFIKA